jgi:aldehyde dehydrogenase (NAD(P)+)
MSPAQTDTDRLDASIGAVRERAKEWADLGVQRRIDYLRGLRLRAGELSQRWVDAAVEGKGLDRASAWVGEEWVSGPWAFLSAVNLQIETLSSMARTGHPPLPSGGVRTRPDGQVVVGVFPHDVYDRLLLNGYHAEVWMEPGVTPDGLLAEMAGFYRNPAHDGRVCVVLGAGNVSSIAPMDLLYKLFAEGFVCVLKLHPVNEYLGPIFSEIFAEMVEAGYVRFVYGGVAVGRYLTRHPDVDEVHVTGSLATHDDIVFGSGPEGEQRKRRNEPITTKRVTSELGGVSPTIVVPGPWTDADVRFQAEHLVTQKLHNRGFNCVAAQVLVLPETWDRSDDLMTGVRELMRTLPDRPAYYPGAAERQQSAVEAYPDAETFGGEVERTLICGLDPTDARQPAFQSEFFGSVFAQTSLQGGTPAEYLRNATAFANERLQGTLGAQLIVHPRTMQELGPELDEALAELRYGSIGVNVWSGGGFLLAQTSWGGFPGQPANDIESGSGVVHNTLLFDQPQKSIVYGPFHPFPRAWLHGQFHLAPKPLWFLTHRHAHTASRRVAEFAAHRRVTRLPGIFTAALRS